MSLSNDYTKQPTIQDFSVLPSEQKQSPKAATDEANGPQIILQSLEDLGESHRSLAGRGSLNPEHTKPSIEAQKALGVLPNTSEELAEDIRASDSNSVVEPEQSSLTPEQEKEQEILRMIAELNSEVEEIDSDLEDLDLAISQVDSDSEEIEINREQNIGEIEQNQEEVSQAQEEIQEASQAISEGEIQLKVNEGNLSKAMNEANSAMEANRPLEAERDSAQRALALAKADIAHLQKFGLNYAVMVGLNGRCQRAPEPRNMDDINALKRNIDFMLMWNDKGKVVGGKKALALLPDILDMPTPHGAIVRMHKSDIILRSDEEQAAFEEAFMQFIIRYAQQRGLDKAEKEKEPEKVKEQERPQEPHRPVTTAKSKVRAPVGNDERRLEQEQRLNEKAHQQEVRFRQKMMAQNRAYHEKRDAIIEEERRKADNA